MAGRLLRAALLTLALLGPAAAQTAGDDQQSFLAKLVSRLLSSPEGTVRVGAVEGALTSDALIRDIEVADGQGPWLRVDRIRLVWKRTALLSRRLEVDLLEIGRIDMTRRPARTAATVADDEPLLPELPVAVLVKAFSVAELALGQPVAGTAARMALTGNASLGAPSAGLQLAFSARRLDADGVADLRLAFVPKGETLDLGLRLREQAGGLLAHALAIEGHPAVDLDLAGTGTLDAWRAKLAFSAGTVAQAEGGATILRQGAARRIDLDVTGQISGLLPPLAATIFSGRTQLSGGLSVQDDGALALSALRLAAAQAELTVSGTLSSERRLDVQALARTLPGAPAPAIRALTLDVRATGPLDAPVISGTVDADVARLEAFAREVGLPLRGAARLKAQVSGVPTERRGEATLSLETTGLHPGNAQLASLLGSRASLAGKARVDGSAITLQGLSLKGQRIDAVLDATLDQTSGGIGGALRLAGKLDGRPVAGSADLASLPGGTIDLKRLDLTVAGGTLRGAVRIAGKGLVTGSVAANLPQLATLSALAGTRLGGSMSGDVVFEAPQGVQSASAKARARGLSGFGAAVGSLDLEARLTGDLARPNGTFRGTLAGVQHPAARSAGLSKLDVKATGRLAGDHAVIDASVAGGPALSLALKGAAPFSGSGKLGLAVTGRINAALANARLSGGQKVSGRIALDAALRGTYANPSIEGAATLANGAFVDLLQGVRLTAINGTARGSGTSLRIEHLTAATPGGGRIAVSGSVSADPARGFPADLRVTGENARLIDTPVVNLVAGLTLAVSGPLASAPVISGDLRILSLDVAIPDRLPMDAAPLAAARHLDPPAQTRARLKVLAEENARAKARRRSAAGGGPRLAVKVAAPSHVFVRGRGIDAELGGDITLSGPIFAPRANGAFELRRGQINMLTQRLEFSRGRLTFFGDLMPELDFIAATSAGGVTAKMAVTGPAEAPVFTLTSEPQLPPDEVLSRLMFERAVGNLSPLQAIELAQAVARLSGHGGPDVLDKVRQALGVDSLDVTAGKDGPSVGASKNITRGVRIGVKAGATPEQSGVTATIDLGRRIRLQGESTAGGKTSVGIGAEIEY